MMRPYLSVWVHELKTADWDKVENTALDALCFKSKDLQLAVWLMESNVSRYGFAGIAPSIVIIQALCESYWESMYPEMVDGDIEFRTNPINWVNEKLSLKLRLSSVTSTQLDGDEYSWNDWENAQRYEQMKMQHRGEIQWEGVTVDSFKQRLAATSKECLFELYEQTEYALKSIDSLVQWLDEKCGSDSPSLIEVHNLAREVNEMAERELTRRGVYIAAPSHNEADSSDGTGSDNNGNGGHGEGGDNPLSRKGPIATREDAFAQLLEAAEFLMRDDPHSPVPYMVYTACSWGEKDAPDLYQELFLQKGGQLNIFEVMGLALSEDKN